MALAFLSIGILVPSFDYESSIQINATPQKCWDTFHDTTTMSRWMDGLESLTLKQGQPLQTGSVYQLIITDHDERIVMNEKIKEVRSPVKISYELNNDVLCSDYTITFTGENPTVLTIHYKVVGRNIIWKSALFVSKGYLEDESKKQLVRLKTLIESPHIAMPGR
jgi:hypothetical protein